MERFILDQDTHHYFRFLSRLVRSLGCKGWVILLDEAELVAKLGRGSRAQAYLNLGRLLGFDPSQGIDGIYVVCAFNTAFREDRVLGEQGDLQQAPGWLRDPRRSRSAHAATVDTTLRILVDEAVHLPAITRDMADSVLQEMRDLHSSAYSWDAPLDRERVLEWTDTSLRQGSVRTTVLAGMEYLDVAYQEGQLPEEMSLTEPYRGSVEEDMEFFESDGLSLEQ